MISRAASRLGGLAGVFLRMSRHARATVPESPMVAEIMENLRQATETGLKRLRQEAVKLTDVSGLNLLCSIPGIGITLACVFTAELAPIERFENPKALIAYAGLDPRVKQSGVFLKRNTHLTKRGSPYLRRAAYIAASIAQRHDAEFKAYYEKKRSEGKRYREATIANARHILNRVYAVWKRGTPYIPNVPAKQPLST